MAWTTVTAATATWTDVTQASATWTAVEQEGHFGYGNFGDGFFGGTTWVSVTKAS